MNQIPKNLIILANKFYDSGYEFYIVGGGVRDLLMDKEPNDFDATTNASPKEILKLLPEAKYENDFGTVIYPVKDSMGKVLSVYEITTYRSEGRYSDKRHPDDVKFEKDLDKDLERRDFTVNAMAIGSSNKKYSAFEKKTFLKGQENWVLIDLFGGEKDIKKKIIRAVGEPSDRFKEDGLRMIRAIRFACQLNFDIEPKTERAISKLASSIKFIANERIKDELIKILKSENPYDGIILLHKTGLLHYILPELEQGIDVKQNHHHIYTVFKHLTESLKHCPSKDWRVRFAALMHDIGKPKSKRMVKGAATFYNHEYIGERMARKILKRLNFSNEDSDKILNLIRHHMFYYNTDEVTAASVRRLIKKVGKENLKDLIDLRIGDRLGSGVKKAKPYRLRHLEYMFKRVQNDPVSVKMLKLNGDYMISELGFAPGPKMGAILDVLLSEVIENPELNKLEYLAKRAKELDKDDLESLRDQAKEKIEEKREEDDKVMKKEYWVK